VSKNSGSRSNKDFKDYKDRRQTENRDRNEGYQEKGRSKRNGGDTTYSKRYQG